MYSFLVILLIFILPDCASPVKERADYWKSELEINIPAGTTRTKAIEWGITRKLKFSFFQSQSFLYSNVEQIQDDGIGFPCSEWNIIIKLALDANDRVVKKEVHTVGKCV